MLNDQEVIIREGGTFSRSNTQRTSIIDLAFANGFKHSTWGNWRYTEASGSDHETILFERISSGSFLSLANTLPPFNTAKADWTGFTRRLRAVESNLLAQLSADFEGDNLEEAATVFANEIEKAASTHIPRLKITERSKPWWTEDLRTIRKALSHTRRQAKKPTATEQHHNNFKRARTRYFNAVKQCKEEHWHRFLTTACENGDVYQAYAYAKGKRSGPSKIPSI